MATRRGWRGWDMAVAAQTTPRPLLTCPAIHGRLDFTDTGVRIAVGLIVVA